MVIFSLDGIMIDICVVGGGPTGLAASIMAKLAGFLFAFLRYFPWSFSKIVSNLG